MSNILFSTFLEIAIVNRISLLHFELTTANIKVCPRRQLLLIPDTLNTVYKKPASEWHDENTKL